VVHQGMVRRRHAQAYCGCQQEKRKDQMIARGRLGIHR